MTHFQGKKMFKCVISVIKCEFRDKIIDYTGDFIILHYHSKV